MKRHETVFVAVVAVLALVAAACSGGGSDPVAADATATAIEAGPTEVTAPDPTSEPDPPPVSDDELVAAAVAELDALIAAGEGPSDTIAYDLLGSRVDDEGVVTLNICAWTGRTVFDQVRDSLYRTRINDDGTIEATHITTPGTVGDCLNTTLIETALDFIDEFDLYWADVNGDPATFTADERTERLLSDDLRARSSERLAGYVDAGIYFEPASPIGDLRSVIEEEILERRYRLNGTGLLELVLCRPMNPGYGTFRDGQLVDDGGSDIGPGQQQIEAYQLTTDPSDPGRWRLSGGDGLIWADCLETGDWIAGANAWRPRDRDLEAIAQ